VNTSAAIESAGVGIQALAPRPELPFGRPGHIGEARHRARPEDFEMIGRTRETLALLHSKWAVDIVFLLASGIRRHARLADNVPGLSKKVLTATLRKLEDDGLVSRFVYPEIPVRVEYTLTQLGWQLTELLMALYEWSVAHEDALAQSSDHPVVHLNTGTRRSIGDVEVPTSHGTDPYLCNATSISDA
jgi:DNA-binding HxlR family transcriptional regulator